MFWNWKGRCEKCSEVVNPMEGIFCANFSNSIRGYAPCQKTWHAACYTCLGKNVEMEFPRMEMEDEAGNLWYKQHERNDRINTGISGANLVMPFQCECCWMRVLENRNPGPGDERLVASIRRVNLDAMTGTSEHTIKSHVGRTQRILAINKKYGKTPNFEPRGPLVFLQVFRIR